MSGGGETVHYKRARFSTRLPLALRYTASHHWLAEESPGVWRVGLTRFATRMLGDLVEFGFEVQPGQRVGLGQRIGWVEGFKALSDLYCVLQGEFAGGNPALDDDITLVDSDSYRRGWLYRVRGEPDPASLDASGYIGVLDGTIDQMLKKQGA